MAKHIFTKCIHDLLREKTRIISTHHFEYLENADLVIVLENGRIVQYGKGGDIIGQMRKSELSKMSPAESYQSLEKIEDSDMIVNEIKNEEVLDKLEEEEIKKQDEEEKEHGVISLIVYKYYTFSVGIILSILTIVFLFLMQGDFNFKEKIYYLKKLYKKNFFSK